MAEFAPLLFFFLLIGLSILRSWLERNKQSEADSPGRAQRAAEEQRQAVEDFLRSLDMDVEEQPRPARRPPPPPPAQALRKRPKPKPKAVRKELVADYQFGSAIEDRNPESAIPERHVESPIEGHTGRRLVSKDLRRYGQDEAYALKTRETESRAHHLLSGSSLRDAIILREVLDKPLSERRPEY